MKNKYKKIVKHIPTLEDHGHLYMYYGHPYSEECDVYGENDEGENLIVSYECDNLCRTIAAQFENDYEWLDILQDKKIKLEKIFEVEVETQELETVASLLLYLTASITLDDTFMEALSNGYLIRLLKRLEQCQ